MSREIHVHLLPALFEPPDVSGGTAVVVDILRASTTMTFALENGADGVMAFGTVEEAFRQREEQGSDSCLLGGERGGIKVDGFDLSNSPDDYGPDVVGGKTIGFTTTNGTKALLKCREASRILIGAFVNISAVAEELRAGQGDVHIVCAGTNGAITGEDVLFAGALVERLRNTDEWQGHSGPADEAGTAAGSRGIDGSLVPAETPLEKFVQYLTSRGKRLTQERAIIAHEILASAGSFNVDEIVARLDKPIDGHRVSRATIYRTISQLEGARIIRKAKDQDDREIYECVNGSPVNDSTEIAVSHWKQECGELKAQRVEPALRRAQGGRNLIKLGYDKDITTAAKCDCLNVVGEVGADGVIRVSNGGASS